MTGVISAHPVNHRVGGSLENLILKISSRVNDHRCLWGKLLSSMIRYRLNVTIEYSFIPYPSPNFSPRNWLHLIIKEWWSRNYRHLIASAVMGKLLLSSRLLHCIKNAIKFCEILAAQGFQGWMALSKKTIWRKRPWYMPISLSALHAGAGIDTPAKYVYILTKPLSYLFA